MTDPLSHDFPISGPQDCIAVISALNDQLAEHPDLWENDTLSTYLTALHAWVADSPSLTAEPAAWALLADGLRAARIYE